MYVTMFFRCAHNNMDMHYALDYLFVFIVSVYDPNFCICI